MCSCMCLRALCVRAFKKSTVIFPFQFSDWRSRLVTLLVLASTSHQPWASLAALATSVTGSRAIDGLGCVQTPLSVHSGVQWALIPGQFGCVNICHLHHVGILTYSTLRVSNNEHLYECINSSRRLSMVAQTTSSLSLQYPKQQHLRYVCARACTVKGQHLKISFCLLQW